MAAEHTPAETQSPEGRVEKAPDRATPVDMLLFEERIGFLGVGRKYLVQRELEDDAFIEECKREIDEEVRDVQMLLQDTGTDRPKKRQMLASVLGPSPSRDQITLFAIARVVKRKTRTQGCFQLKFLRKILPSGPHSLREIGTKFDTCMDGAALTAALASEYGIPGRVARPGKLIHFYSQADEGTIVDTFWLKDQHGLLRDPSAYNKVAHP